MATEIKRETINIPKEILEEILYNLPVKSLLRFKCVSKQWRSLISSKQFIKRHLKKSNTNPDIPHHTIIFRLSHMILQQNAPLEPLEYPLRSLLYGPITTFDNRPRQTTHAYRMWGSCNGLRLVTVDAIHLFLFNPSTLKYRRVQQGESGRHSGRFIYGLGYDESTDDYKVVSINIQSNPKPCRTRIYSSRTGSWKEIEDFDKCFPVDDSGKFVNRRLHWLSRNHEIVVLDLVEEKYEIMARPENFSSSFPYQPILGDLGGYLSLIGHRRVDSMLESTVPMLDTNVWVMTKYGVRESWTKIWMLSDFADPKNHIRGAIPLFLNKNGDIAVALGSSVVVYNGKNKVHESRGAIVNDIFESVVYVESLVSPFGDEELGR